MLGVELFIILSHVTATCGPLHGRMERRAGRGRKREWELQTETEIDGLIKKGGSKIWNKKMRIGMIPPSCAVQMSDCVQASQYRPLGQAQPGEAH